MPVYEKYQFQDIMMHLTSLYYIHPTYHFHPISLFLLSLALGCRSCYDGGSITRCINSKPAVNVPISDNWGNNELWNCQKEKMHNYIGSQQSGEQQYCAIFIKIM